MRKLFIGLAALCVLAQPVFGQAPILPAAPGQGDPMPETQAPPAPPPLDPAENELMRNFQPVTDEILANPDPSDWMMLRGNYEGWGHSQLDQINKENVGDLTLVWSRAMNPGINEAAPVVYDGIMFLPNPADVIQAVPRIAQRF